MNFISTRGGEKVSAARAIVNGLADNGGLYVPEKFPSVSAEEMQKMLEMSYPERAAKVLKKYTENVTIKWPNDVFVNGKKICGILLESVITENITEAVFLGIGVNITNDIPKDLQSKATSLKL